MYRLKALTIRTNNSEQGVADIVGLWTDLVQGKYPVAFEDGDVSFPIARYDNYENDEKGAFDYTIMEVSAPFIEEKEAEVRSGKLVKYEERDDEGDVVACTARAWQQVWDDQRKGKLTRAFTADYELTISARCSKDGRAYCRLYIAAR